MSFKFWPRNTRVAVTALTLTLAVSLPLFAVASAVAPVSGAETQEEPNMRAIFDHALTAAELRPDQQSEVDMLRTASTLRHQSIRKARIALGLSMADQLERQHQLDRCALTQEIDHLVMMMARSRPQDIQAFMKLHAILDTDQRERFITTLDREVRSAETQAHDPEMVAQKLSRKLSLSDSQSNKVMKTFTALMVIRDQQPWFEARKARWTRLVESFKGDSFDIESIAPAETFAQRANGLIVGHLWAMEPLVTLLTDQQKETLAAVIRAKAERLQREGTTTSGASLAPEEP